MALTTSPSPAASRGRGEQTSPSPVACDGRRGWGMRASFRLPCDTCTTCTIIQHQCAAWQTIKRCRPIHTDGPTSHVDRSLPSLADVRIQRVHSLTRTDLPSTTRVTVWRFGLKRRRVCRCEKLTALPKAGPLLHSAHLAIVRCLLKQKTFRPVKCVLALRKQPCPVGASDCSRPHYTIAGRTTQLSTRWYASDTAR